MRFAAQYLWDHRNIILLEILSAGIFAGVFYLYHLPLSAVLYPTALCAMLGLLFAAILCVIFVLGGRGIFSWFSNETAILDYGQMIMRILSVVIFLQISQVVYSGCLRGAGDTRYTALVSLISVAFIRPGSGWLFCYPLGLGLFGAWIGLAFDQLMRFILTRIRFQQGKWTTLKI